MVPERTPGQWIEWRTGQPPDERRGNRRGHWLLLALAMLAAGIVSGTAYALTIPILAPYVPFGLSSGQMYLVVLAATALHGLAQRQPRAALASVPLIAALGGGLYGLVLALPALVDTTAALNGTGLVNYALTQGAFAFFLILPIAFFGASLGIVGHYVWQDRRT